MAKRKFSKSKSVGRPVGSGQISRIVHDWLILKIRGAPESANGSAFSAREVSELTNLSEKAVSSHLAQYSREGVIKYVGHRNRRAYFCLVPENEANQPNLRSVRQTSSSQS